jgi:hypothetical protein
MVSLTERPRGIFRSLLHLPATRHPLPYTSLKFTCPPQVVEAAGSTAQESGRRAATALADYFGLKPAAGAKGGASSGFTVALHAVDGGAPALPPRVGRRGA